MIVHSYAPGKHNSIDVGKLHTHARGNIITLRTCSGKGIYVRIRKNCTCDKMADLVAVSL